MCLINSFQKSFKKHFLDEGIADLKYFIFSIFIFFYNRYVLWIKKVGKCLIYFKVNKRKDRLDVRWDISEIVRLLTELENLENHSFGVETALQPYLHFIVFIKTDFIESYGLFLIFNIGGWARFNKE